MICGFVVGMEELLKRAEEILTKMGTNQLPTAEAAIAYASAIAQLANAHAAQSLAASLSELVEPQQRQARDLERLTEELINR